MRLLAVAVCTIGLTQLAGAAEQTILGSSLSVKNNGQSTGRKVSLKAKEKLSPNTLAGNPVTSGARIGVLVEGADPSDEVFDLPNGNNMAGKPFWSGDAVKGYKYKDSKGENGSVKSARIKAKNGVFQIKLAISSKFQSINLEPPNPGTGGCGWLGITSGDTYFVKFGDGKITNKDTRLFKVTKPTTEGKCCTHDKCVEGGPLVLACDPCVALVCDNDNFCCDNNWDDQCVSEVGDYCGTPCPTCGDSVVEAPEACDPPGVQGACDPGEVCSATCSTCTTCPTPTIVGSAGGVFVGTTVGGSTIASGSCRQSQTGASPERFFQWTPGTTHIATIKTCGGVTDYDSVIYMLQGATCVGTDVACNDDGCSSQSQINPLVVAGTTYTIVVDGYFSSGNFTLSVSPSGAFLDPADIL